MSQRGSITRVGDVSAFLRGIRRLVRIRAESDVAKPGIRSRRHLEWTREQWRAAGPNEVGRTNYLQCARLRRRKLVGVQRHHIDPVAYPDDVPQAVGRDALVSFQRVPCIC